MVYKLIIYLKPHESDIGELVFMTVDFSTFRVNMVNNQLRTADVTDPLVLQAFLSIKREEFLCESSKDLAYIDDDIPFQKTKLPRYLMEPAPLAKLVQLAALRKQDVVLHIGAATGYGSAILSSLAQTVIAIEEEPTLLSFAKKTLSKPAFANITLLAGQLNKLPAISEVFDLIFIEGSVDFVPPIFFDQLKENGKLVVVEGCRNNGVAKLYVKKLGVVASRSSFNLNVKELPGFERLSSYVF